MVSNEEIMDMLKVILEKVERLECIKTDNVTINSGTITIQTEDGAIDIQEADGLLIQAAGKHNQIAVEQVEEISVVAENAKAVTIECAGDISGDVTVSSSEKSVTSLQYDADMQENYNDDED